MICSLVLLLFSGGCATNGVIGADKLTVQEKRALPYLIHLPGVTGVLEYDRNVIQGLEAGGVEARWSFFDWTLPGLGAFNIGLYERNQAQAEQLAEHVTKLVRENPQTPVNLIAGSAGAAVAVWALEKLPQDVSVQTVLLLSPALSSDYDLTAALRRVDGQMHVFYSEKDTMVLAIGTSMVGTMDGPRTVAAGLHGFVMPRGADTERYTHLRQWPYESAWAQWGHNGQHTGAGSEPFAREVLAPIFTRELLASPKPQNHPHLPRTAGVSLD